MMQPVESSAGPKWTCGWTPRSAVTSRMSAVAVIICTLRYSTTDVPGSPPAVGWSRGEVTLDTTTVRNRNLGMEYLGHAKSGSRINKKGLWGSIRTYCVPLTSCLSPTYLTLTILVTYKVGRHTLVCPNLAMCFVPWTV